MNGTVKWFSKEKGYGFIYTPGGKDYFFHVSQVLGEKLPGNGDLVTFTPEEGENGKLSATNVIVTEEVNQGSNVPYYGKATYRTIRSASPGLVFVCGVICAIIGGFNGGFKGGFFGVIIGVSIGILFGRIIGGGEEKKVEITSPCLKCGGTGQVTSRVDGRIGFQCKVCKKYWTKLDEY